MKQYWQMWSENEANILIGDVTEEDKLLFFGPLYDFDKFTQADPNFRYPQLLKELGFFKSSGQARKAGWDKDIPLGWSEHTIGKLRRRLYIFKRI